MIGSAYPLSSLHLMARRLERADSSNLFCSYRTIPRMQCGHADPSPGDCPANDCPWPASSALRNSPRRYGMKLKLAAAVPPIHDSPIAPRYPRHLDFASWAIVNLPALMSRTAKTCRALARMAPFSSVSCSTALSPSSTVRFRSPCR